MEQGHSPGAEAKPDAQPPAASAAPATPAARIAADCLAVRARLLSRAVSGLYDDALRPWGLKVSQLNLLVALALLGPARPATLTRTLYLDASTLSRNLDRLETRGLVHRTPGDDARMQRLQLTAAGLRLIEELEPAWRNAQEAALRLLGDEGAAALGAIGSRLLTHGARGEAE